MKLDPKTTAVLAMDLQNGILAMAAENSDVITHAKKAADTARAQGLRVYHVGLGFSPDYVEISPENKRFSQLRERKGLQRGTEQTVFHPAVFREGETVITKYRVSAFAGSPLETIMRAQNVKTLVLFGVATSGVVLSTVRQAADLDYEIIVIKDACFDRDPEVHRVLTEKVFVGQAKVISVDDFAKGNF